MKKLRVLVLGAGFAGLELSTILSEAIGDQLDLTLIDQSEAFIFGFSKLDVMFGHQKPEQVKLHYRHFNKPGVQFRQETLTEIDPEAKRVKTDRGSYEADVLVIALGADYDFQATPGLVKGENEFYTFAGAQRLAETLSQFSQGKIVIGISGTPYKCPPAPYEAAFMLHDHLTKRGVRDRCEISVVTPFGVPIPPSPETSTAILAAFSERKMNFIAKKAVQAIDAAKGLVQLDDSSTLPCDLYLGVPKHCVPEVVAASGLTQEGWIVPNPKNLKTQFPGVYAVGDVTRIGPPKAGLFAEGMARVGALSILADFKGGASPADYDGAGTCYIEFGGGKVGRVDVNFLSGPTPTGRYHEPSVDLVKEKQYFGSSRRARWFGLCVWILAILIGGILFSPSLISKETPKDPLKGMKPPTSQWTLRKFKKEELKSGIEEELRIGVKNKIDLVNIGLRIGTDLPIDSHSFLDQVRTRITAEKDYEGAEITVVRSQELGGKEWDFFSITRKDEVKQEFWARSISSDRILMLLFTALDGYFEQYRSDFLKVLQQASRN